MAPRPNASRRPAGATVALLIALAMVPYFVRLGTPPLWDANESLYAQPPREIVEWPQGDFLAPTWNGRPYFAHTPLATWVTVPFYVLLGPSELAHRLPMALAAVLIVLATYRLGRLAAGRRAALLAALLLAATPRFWLFSRQLPGDVYLLALLTWAFALALPALAGGGRRGALRLAHVLVGIGFLAKGPVILVLYGGGLGLTWLLARPRAPLAELRPLRGLLSIVALGAPWFVYMALRYDTFLGEHFGHYTFGRVLGSIGDRGWAWYLLALLGDAQPWLPVLPFGIVMALRRDRRPATLLPMVVLAWTVVFFSVSAGKRNVYMLPVYPMMAVLIAPAGLAVIDGAYRWSARLAGFAAAFGCLAAAIVLHLVAQNEARLRPEIYWPIGLLAVACLPLGFAGWKGLGRMLTTGAIGTVLAAQLAVCLAFPAVARFRPIPAFAERIRAEQDATHPEPAINYRSKTHSLNFYLGRPTAVANAPDDLRDKMGDRRVAFLVVPARRFDAPDRRDPDGGRIGLEHEMPGALFDVLERAPLLDFNFRRSVLGRDGPTTKDLLLVRITRSGEERK
jgi:4-amino-4-deoxy-L-arabinose transferase-like glycosyltransferase